jgi:hypothetical protein
MLQVSYPIPQCINTVAHFPHSYRRLATWFSRATSICLVVLTHHPSLIVPVLLYVVGAALWEGIRPEVVKFAAAAASAFFAWLRRTLHLPPDI